VIVDAPEVELGAEAREVAGIGGRARAGTLIHGQAEGEGVRREGGVDVQIAEQDLLVARCSQIARRVADPLRVLEVRRRRPLRLDAGARVNRIGVAPVPVDGGQERACDQQYERNGPQHDPQNPAE
jgi:hypothetical protein